MKNFNQCYLNEVYSAIQGEGPLVGIRQIFIRFSICDLRCIWCDTPGSLVRAKYYQFEKVAGSRNFHKAENPLNIETLISIIESLNKQIHHSISLTGGEPLLQSGFLNNFLPVLKNKTSLPVYLETGGHRVLELENIINFIDYISMDFKLPSSAKTTVTLDQHKNFLSLSINAKKKVWVKIVLTCETDFNELCEYINLVKLFSVNNQNIEIFLQPVTEVNGTRPLDELALLSIHSRLLEIYPFIRVLPQVHKLISQK